LGNFAATESEKEEPKSGMEAPVAGAAQTIAARLKDVRLRPQRLAQEAIYNAGRATAR